MPAELSVLTRYPCDIPGCDRFFKLMVDYEKHLQDEHEGEQEAKSTQEEIPCSYATCSLVFKSSEEMRSHKGSESEHFYCGVCDIDCEDWEDLVKHKVASEQHIACGICGAEYNGHPGLKAHVKQRHARSQNIQCRGCECMFPTAAGLVSHLEKGQCHNKKAPGKSITTEKFDEHLSHKAVVTTLVERLDYQSKNIGIGPTDEQIMTFDPSKAAPSTSEAAWDSVPPPPSWSVWPGLKKQTNEQDIDLIHLESDDEKQETVQSKSAASAWNQPGAWSQQTPASKVLFPDSKAQDATEARKRAGSNGLSEKDNVSDKGQSLGPRELKSQRLVVHAHQNTGKELKLNSNFWNPNSAAYDPEIFYDEARGCYRCPHNSYTICFYYTEDAAELTNHLQVTEHKRDTFNCPACNNPFRNLTGLVAHCESYSKRCRVRTLRNYDEIMERLTGGHVKVVNMDRSKNKSNAACPLGGNSKGNANPEFDRKNADHRKKFLDEMHEDEAWFQTSENDLVW